MPDFKSLTVFWLVLSLHPISDNDEAKIAKEKIILFFIINYAILTNGSYDSMMVYVSSTNPKNGV